MSQVINTNSLSLVAKNNLNKSQSSLGTAIERLSSGMRINSAKDDAAGQAISNRFTANITGLTQASRNANDGISLAQTTEGALNEINDNLQNIRRLTVQAANGTNSASDRQSIQDEIDARLAEIDRISEQTEFNGVKVLSKDQTLDIQVGANDNETIGVELKQANARNLGIAGFDISDDGTGRPLMAGMKYFDGTTTNTITKEDIAGLRDILFGANDVGTFSLKTNDAGVSQLFVSGENPMGDRYNALVDLVFDPEAKPVGAVMLDDAEVEAMKAGMEYTSRVDRALAEVDAMRSGLGAVQNRFNSVITNLDSAVNNLSESRSRIMDADYATEVSNMSRANILQSAGTTVLAQANQVPQNVLSLLR